MLKFLAERRDKYESMLLSLRSHFLFAGEVSRDRFGMVAKELIARHPGVLALEWVPRVPAEEREAVEAKARTEGFPHFQFLERDSRASSHFKFVKAGNRSEYYPILFKEPQQGDSRVLGYDLFSCDIQPILAAARNTGLTTSTPVRQVAAESRQTFEFVVAIPVYHNWPPPSDASARQAQLKGFLQAVFQVDELFGSMAPEMSIPGVEIFAWDSVEGARGQLLYSSLAFKSEQRVSPSQSVQFKKSSGSPSVAIEFPIGARNWHVEFYPNADWLKANRGGASLALLLGGFSVTGLLAAGFHAGARREALVSTQVERRTSELKSTLALLEREVTDRKQTESALHSAHSHLLTAQRLGRIGSWALDLGTESLVWSKEVFRIFGQSIDSFVPTRESFSGLVHPEDVEELKNRAAIAIRDIHPYSMEHRIVLPDGSIRHVVEHAEVIAGSDGKPAQMLGAVQDVTESKRAAADREILDRRVRETQKLESLGVLAGGIAHDFNNLLTVILGNAGLARLELPPGCKAESALDQIEFASKRSADLCFQMLAYAGKGRYSLKPLDLTHLVQEAVPLMNFSIHGGCKLRLNLAEGLPAVRGDEDQLKQMLMNLVVNASEAITQSEGSITVATGLERLEAAALKTLRGATDLTPGEYAYLEVADTGCGMSPETLSKVFEPFFSTKFAGRGLGLAATFGIVRTHSGALKVTSELGKGSAFRIILPIVSAEARATDKPLARSQDAPGAGAVLVIDDEESVRVFVNTVLTHEGFEVLLARDGCEGLDLFRNSRLNVQLVILDMVMPRMGGEETYQALKEMRPDVPVFIMSGYLHKEVMARFAGQEVFGFLQKPFGGAELIAEVKRVMSPVPQP